MKDQLSPHAESRLSAAPTSRIWWHEQGITRLVAGVFEGGGAKGLLYRGALDGMLEEACWFGAAAGASAGAITATAIAVGLQPDEVGRETGRALDALRKPTHVNGLLRIRNGASYLDQDSLRDWLAELLERQVKALCGEADRADITFGQLHQLTDGFELNIVAVDLARQHRVVFNYMLTPNCSVASAVVASAAIPLVFEPMPLSVPQQPASGLIVDGGVLANFPSFVFKDTSYREWAGLPPLAFPVVGFLLDEEIGSRVVPDLYRRSVFLRFGDVADDSGNALAGKPRFQKRREKHTMGARAALAVSRGLRVILWPAWKLLFEWMPAAMRWNAGGQHGNWPEPKSPTLRSLVGWFDAVMTGIRPGGLLVGGFVAATLCIGVGAYFAAWRPLAGHVADVLNGDVSVLGATLGTVIGVFWALVPIYAWIVISLVLGLGWLLHRTVQITGYGLVRTFLAGSGAPVWTGAAPDDHVVRLRVPRGIDTLTVSLGRDEMNAALNAAHDKTRSELRQVDFGSVARLERA
jgi:predicted acylesterase/phospholipase RssA